VAFKNGLWDDEMNSCLMKRALKGANKSCGDGMALAGLLEFQNILQAKMGEVVSEVSIFTYINPHSIYRRC
jgi:hypothetical protein